MRQLKEDRRWGCGYRNFQMLFSSLVADDVFYQHLSQQPFFKGKNKSPLAKPPYIPSIITLQDLIECAWKEGFDPEGAAHFKYRLKYSSRWIGATEIVAALRYLRIRTNVIDFHKPTGSDGKSHPEIFQFVKTYFKDGGDGHGIPCSSNSLSNSLSSSLSNSSSNSLSNTCTTLLNRCVKFPLYWQHQGHSRSIIGMKPGVTDLDSLLFVFDPQYMIPESLQQVISERGKEKKRRCHINLIKKFGINSNEVAKHAQYQIVYVNGIMSEYEVNDSKIITSTRIP